MGGPALRRRLVTNETKFTIKQKRFDFQKVFTTLHGREKLALKFHKENLDDKMRFKRAVLLTDFVSSAVTLRPTEKCENE